MNPHFICRKATRLAALAAVLAAVGLSGPGCSTTGKRGRPLVPTRTLTQIGPYRIWTHEALPADEPVLAQLGDLERGLESRLGVRIDPRQAPIDLYVLQDQAAFSQFLTFYYPELPARRAFFLAQDDRRIVYTYAGVHLMEDVRHELTHALLHASFSDLPLWLDEGLAEYFEAPSDWNGYQPEHMQQLANDLADGWRPDLPRLEGLTSPRSLTARDYREAWGWAHCLMNGPAQNRAALTAYLAERKTAPSGTATTSSPLSARLAVVPDDLAARFVVHLGQVQPPSLVRAPSVSDSAVVRTQGEPIEPPPVPARRALTRRRSVLGRVAGLFGL